MVIGAPEIVTLKGPKSRGDNIPIHPPSSQIPLGVTQGTKLNPSNCRAYNYQRILCFGEQEDARAEP